MNGSRRDEAISHVIKRFKTRRREREIKDGISLLEKLKERRQAAGLPLNPIQQTALTRGSESKSSESLNSFQLKTSSHGAGTKSPDSLPSVKDEFAAFELRKTSTVINGKDQTETECDVTSATKRTSKQSFSPKRPSPSVITVDPFQDSEYSSYKYLDDPKLVSCTATPTLLFNFLTQGNLPGDWQSRTSLLECNLFMLMNKIGCDVTLLVGVRRARMLAHSFVLKSRSAKFATLLDDYHQRVLTVSDVELDIFDHFLRYLYTDFIDLDVLLATRLATVADTFRVPQLRTKCFVFLMSNITVDNVCNTLELAHTLRENVFYAECLTFVHKHGRDALQAHSLNGVCKNCLEEIVKSDHLLADELDVYNALIKWAKNDCVRNRLSPSDWNIRETLGPLLYHARFATMDIQAFTKRISCDNVLLPKEKISLYQFYHGAVNKLPKMFRKDKRRQHTPRHDVIPTFR